MPFWVVEGFGSGSIVGIEVEGIGSVITVSAVGIATGSRGFGGFDVAATSLVDIVLGGAGIVSLVGGCECLGVVLVAVVAIFGSLATASALITVDRLSEVGAGCFAGRVLLPLSLVVGALEEVEVGRVDVMGFSVSSWLSVPFSRDSSGKVDEAIDVLIDVATVADVVGTDSCDCGSASLFE